MAGEVMKAWSARWAAKSALGASLALGLGACANGPCRHLREPRLAEGQAAAEAASQTSAAKAVATPVASGSTASSGGPVSSVFVYKPDGSLQCGTAKGLSLEEMEKQLRGMPVLSRDKRPDGKMHIQVCGSPTGMINVFEIDETHLKEAEARGFKKL
jgi:hypothetical protein